MLRSFTLLSVVGLFICLASLPATRTIASQNQPSAAVNEKERGIELFRLDRIDEAVTALKKAVQENRQDYEAWHFLGLALIKKKELKEASKSFETALMVKPAFAPGHAGLAYSLLLRNKSSDAVREAQAALAIDSGIPDAHYIIGVVRLRAGKKDDALREADAVIKIKPDFGPAYLLKSQALAGFSGSVLVAGTDDSLEFIQERYREAAFALEKYLQLVPNGEYKDTWIEQLESLRAFGKVYRKGDPNAIVPAREATTKARVLAKPEPTYTERARKNQVTGTVVLRCVFAADGLVKHMLVVVGLPDGLTENAIRAARKIKFVPATVNGQPVSMLMELQYNFNLY